MPDQIDEKGTLFRATRSDASSFSRQWLLETVDGLQRLAGHLVGSTVWDQESRLIKTVQKLPKPVTVADRMWLRGVLWESATRLGAAAHLRLHQDREAPCGLKSESLVVRSFSETLGDPREAFKRWTRSFFEELRRVHPPSSVELVAGMIRERCDRPLDIANLAAKVHLTPATLRRAFCSAYGRTPKKYHSELRMLRALERIGSEKVESLAFEMGYRSKKNFYRMFKKLTGLTPSAFRQLPRHDQGALILRAKTLVLESGRP